MTRRFGVTIDCADPASQARFWIEVLGYQPDGASPEDAPEGEGNWAAIAAPEGDRPSLFFQRVPEGKVAKNRMHLDIDVAGEGPVEERRARIDAEVARLKALGASDHRGAHAEGNAYWVRMNDPEGNEFCLV
jgi:catechol 2,3-dioxygenase-like lactoylglutathione lyase family enzyme